ncbi:MAG: ABC transporter ATP-binding protein, partial [Paraclostridium sp.]
ILESKNSLSSEYIDDLILAINKDINNIEIFINEFIFNNTSIILKLFISIVYLWSINKKLLLISLIAIPIQLAISSVVIKFLNENLEKKRDINYKLVSFCRDKLNNLKITKAFNLENTIIYKFEDILDMYISKIVIVCKVNSILKIFNLVVEMMPFILTFLFGGYFVVRGDMNFGQLMIFNSLLDNISTPLKVIPTMPNTYISAKISYKKLKEMMYKNTYVNEYKINDNYISTSKDSLVLFKNVNFKINNNDTILENINFEIKKGEKVVLVGRSGSGKSTLIDLICGFINQTSGSILFEDKDTNILDKDILRKNISLVNQNPNLFPWTILENITSGNVYSDAEVVKIANNIKAHEFIELKSNSYGTVLNENSDCLSGGEKQKIAIARALIKPSKLLILDEPTSALDRKSEESVMNIISSIKDKAILIVSHNPEYINNADKVFIIKNKSLEQISQIDEFLRNPYLFY